MTRFLRELGPLLRPYRGRLLLGVLAGIVAGLLEPLLIVTITFVYGVLFPSATGPSPAGQLLLAPGFLRGLAVTAHEALGGTGGHPGSVTLLVAAIPAVVLLRGLFSYLNIYNLQWTATRAVGALRIRLFEHLMSLSAGFFQRTNTGELMSRVMNDTGTLHSLLSNLTTWLVKDPVALAGLVVYLLWRHPKLTLISLIVLPACLVPIVVYSRKARRASSALQGHLAELGGVMSESFSGIRVIKAYNLEPAVASQFRTAVGRFVGQQMRIVRSIETPGPLLEFAGATGVALVLIHLASQGGVGTSGADFLAVVLAIYSMYKPIKNLARLHNNLEQARAASERAFELLAARATVPEAAHPSPIRVAGARIELAGVDFGYGGKAVLHGIDLTIEPGRMVALVGPSGSGKTSLVNLLLRLYDPLRGSVRIGGTDLREASVTQLRGQIAVVTQETILFNETIRRNIELGRAGATEAEVVEAARRAHAWDFIVERPEGFETVVGEKGCQLSGGERQRLAIARAILRDAPLLILDEATSALDSEAEGAVQRALEELAKGRTTVCIAHRLSTVRNADTIVVLEEGRIVEKGRHEELLRRGGLYAKLHELQSQAGAGSA